MVRGRKKKEGSDLSQLLYYTLAFSDGPTTVKSTFSAQKYPCHVKLAFPPPASTVYMTEGTTVLPKSCMEEEQNLQVKVP